ELTRDRSDWYLVPFVPDIVRLSLAVDRGNVARRLLDRMKDLTVQHTNSLVTGQALFAEFEGRFDEATRLFDDSAARWRSHGFVFELGQSLLGAGRCLTKLGRPEGADRLREARTVFRSLNARPLLSQLEPWLGRAHAGSTSDA
ncbi:MAG TPA: hypothetical protein VEQ37_06525, partial [Actinomycetota bacterium]|nr:hypothetical protein [Actinomycetota bacterium]